MARESGILCYGSSMKYSLILHEGASCLQTNSRKSERNSSPNLAQFRGKQELAFERSCHKELYSAVIP